jgi:signal transduction histidine kinase
MDYFRRTVHFGRIRPHDSARNARRSIMGGNERLGATENRSMWGRVVAPVVALFIAASSLTVAVLASQVSSSQEHELLRERAGELAALLNVSTSDSRSVLLVAGTSMQTPGGVKTFNSVTARLVLAGTGAVAVVRRTGAEFRVVVSAGRQAPAKGTVLDPVVAAVIARAQSAKDMVSAVVDVADTRHAVLALAVASDPTQVAFLDSVLAPATNAPRNVSSPFNELDVALYASGVVDPNQLVLVSGDVPSSGDGVVVKQFKVGVDTWSLAVSARTPLIGTMATAFPWVLGASGVLTAAVLGLLIETLVRRRAYALRLVDERTGLLQDAQVAAEKANQDREAFFASVSHDIRAPLTAIMGFTELMATAEPEQQDEFVQRVRSNVATLGVMVDNMLDHARLQAGALDVELEPLCLKELVEGCVQDLGPVLASHKVAIDGPSVKVMADRLAFGRVLANILINAVRYSPRGTPIDVDLSGDPGCGRVAVADRGRGIEEEDLATIFDEFARGSRAKVDGGSGLGLFSVHQLVALQHGSVGIVSSPGEGTTVTIELPLCV